jgi:hypothetical protein
MGDSVQPLKLYADPERGSDKSFFRKFCLISAPGQHIGTAHRWGGRVEPDRNLSKTEKIATIEEIDLAIEKLTPAEWAKLHAFARNRARMMALRGCTFIGEDLLGQAVVALLDERRRWNPKKVNFVGVLMGAIKSIASNYLAATEDGNFALPVSQVSLVAENGDTTSTAMETPTDRRPNSEQIVVVSNLLAEVYYSFRDDPEALVIMDGWRDRMTGPEIIEALGIDRNAYETIVRRIRRKSAVLWPKGSRNVR